MLYFRVALCWSPESSNRSEWPWPAPPSFSWAHWRSISAQLRTSNSCLSCVERASSSCSISWVGLECTLWSCLQPCLLLLFTRFPGPGSWVAVDGLCSQHLALPAMLTFCGWCPTAKVTIYVRVTLSSPSLGKQTITFFPGFKILLLKSLKDLGPCTSWRV